MSCITNLHKRILKIQLTRLIRIQWCSNVREFKLNKKRPNRIKKTTNAASHSLTSVLPRIDSEVSPTIENIDKQLSGLDSLLANLNLKIAEQQEQLNLEEEEMQRRFGVALPPEYVNMVGSVDPHCPPSKYPCVGCGAPIHCCYPHRPGFISSSRFKALSNLQKQNSKCLRCRSLDKHDALLDAQVSEDEYRRILSSVRQQRSLILHVVDVTDFYNGIIYDLLDIVSPRHPVYIIANKVDLLPKDSRGYLHHVEKCVTYYAHKYFGYNLKHVALTSALTGYGIEQLITKIFNHGFTYGSNLHLVGCTNSGKSSLFNSLLMSDLCKVTARDNIARATTSIWPGTTLNLLKFPVNRPSKYMLAMRTKRLIEANMNERESQGEPTEHTIKRTPPSGLVQATAEPEEEMDYDMMKDLPSDVDAKQIDPHYKFDVGDNEVREMASSAHPKRLFDYDKFADSKWLYDTPGLVNYEQIINNINMSDLKRLLMRENPVPRAYSLRPGMTLFIGGVGRIDLLEMTDDANPVYLTVICTASLPIAVVYTQNAEEYYQKAMLEDKLQIPSTKSNMENLPELAGRVVTVSGVGYDESETDIQLSSIGWVAVTYAEGQSATLKAYTPGGAGCHTRYSLLPYAVTLKGKKISGSRAFRQRRTPIL